MDRGNNRKGNKSKKQQTEQGKQRGKHDQQNQTKISGSSQSFHQQQGQRTQGYAPQKSSTAYRKGHNQSPQSSEPTQSRPYRSPVKPQEQHVDRRYQSSSRPQQGQNKRATSDRSVTSNRQPSTLPSTVSAVNAQEPLPPLRPVSLMGVKRGTVGKPDIVEVNYLKLDISKMPDTVYHYDVRMKPDHSKLFSRVAFEQFQRIYCPDIPLAFDGVKSCYSAVKLPDQLVTEKVNVDDNGHMKEYEITVKETDKLTVDMTTLQRYQNDRVGDKPMAALQVIEVVLASKNHELGVRVGRSFYRKPREFYDLGDGYEMYTGIYQAAILGDEPLFNVDISHKSFPQAVNILTYLKSKSVDIRYTITDKRKLESLTNYLNGLRIVYNPPKCFGMLARQYTIVGLGLPANKNMFDNSNGETISIQKYYESRGYKIEYPNLNCLLVGSANNTIALPIELCTILEHQAVNRKDGVSQVSQMIKYTATPSLERKHKISELLKYFDHNSNPVCRAFGLSLGSSFIRVHMRLLPPPLIEYGHGRTISVTRGVWRADNVNFLKGCSKPNAEYKCAIACDKNSSDYNTLETLKESIQKAAKRLNMRIISDIKVANFRQIDSLFSQLKKDQYDLVFVIVPISGTSYGQIKKAAEIDYGIVTQCIKQRTLLRAIRDQSIVNNVLLKVNTKLNGTNHKIVDEASSIRDLFKNLKNVMFIGADVTHPSPDQFNIPSIVGVVASHDEFGACYNMQYRLQRPTLETIREMEKITEHHLQVYKQHRKCYPNHVIYYRDGVSDGQFAIIRNVEVMSIRAACNRVCKAKVTCIVVVKRHHTRFFPTGSNQSKNVEPGTVVDQYIVHPNEQQFFLVSHQAIQGTARPTRYNIIYDDAKMDIDLVQKLTYNLCHLFPRCNRAVSYPAPAYLAHLVAFRGRVYLEGNSHRLIDLEKEYNRRLVDKKLMSNSPMYFI